MVWFDLIWLDSIWFDRTRFYRLQCNAMRWWSVPGRNSSRCRKKTEPSINLEQTTPCTRAPAQNLLIRTVSLTTHETKMIEYKYFSCSFCLALPWSFYCQREMIDKSKDNGEIRSIGRVNLSKHMRLPCIAWSMWFGLIWLDSIWFDQIRFYRLQCNAMRWWSAVSGITILLVVAKNRTKYKSGTDYALYKGACAKFIDSICFSDDTRDENDWIQVLLLLLLLALPWSFYCQREMIDKSKNNGEIKSIGRVNLSKHMRLPWILDVCGLVWFDWIQFDLIEFDSIGCNAMRCDDEVLFPGSSRKKQNQV